METTELWRPVVGYEFEYEVSNFGNIRRKAGSDNCPNGRPRKLVQRGKYFQVILSKNNKVALHWVHRLVGFAFIGPPPHGTDRINHKDGNGLNNRVENLEWTNHSRNIQHAYDTGLRHATPPRGEANGNAMLSDLKVKDIRKRRASGQSLASIGRHYGITRSHVWQVVNRRAWRHVK